MPARTGSIILPDAEVVMGPIGPVWAPSFVVVRMRRSGGQLRNRLTDGAILHGDEHATLQQALHLKRIHGACWRWMMFARIRCLFIALLKLVDKGSQLTCSTQMLDLVST
jgi:hypothetical protein